MNQRKSGLAWSWSSPGAEAVHVDLDEPGKLSRQVFDVDAGTAVDVRRIFASKQRDAHVFHPSAADRSFVNPEVTHCLCWRTVTSW